MFPLKDVLKHVIIDSNLNKLSINLLSTLNNLYKLDKR